MIAARRLTLELRASTFICASISLVALLAHIAGVLEMRYFLFFFGIPSLLFLTSVAAYARLIDQTVFVNVLEVGLFAGIVATVAYDVARLALMETHIFDYDSYKAITIFGSWITKTPRTTSQSFLAGWTYHYWNGISFSIMYMVIFARWHWLWGVGYGLVMEMAMLGIFPLFLTINNPAGFVALSLTGHVVYGVVIGLAGQRYARSFSEAR
ncbi:MAG: hypothetical protein NVSMB52_12680 [Chloroflexota bacterium]